MRPITKSLARLMVVVAVFPWLPKWFQLAGLSPKAANFWTLGALLLTGMILAFYLVTDGVEE